jgi:hypothetical protein
MLGFNGGLMGIRRTPTNEAASGLWFQNEQSVAERAGIWYGDPYFSDVSLLLHMDGSNGSTTFTDSSSNAVAVTANGNAQISTAQNKFGGSSGSFSSGYIITPASSLFNFGTGDFCIEFWCYFNSVASNQRVGGGDLQAGGAFNWAIYTTSSGQLDYYLGTGSTWDIAAAKSIGAISTGQWYHVVLARNGTTFNGFLNGVFGDITTSSAALAANSTNGAFFGTQATSYFDGYLDEIRVTKGVSRYAANTNFTPPAGPFPNS